MKHINVEKIADDACAHAELELRRLINDRMENRKHDTWTEDWAEISLKAIPQAIKVALIHTLNDLQTQLEQN